MVHIVKISYRSVSPLLVLLIYICEFPTTTFGGEGCLTGGDLRGIPKTVTIPYRLYQVSICYPIRPVCHLVHPTARNPDA